MLFSIELARRLKDRKILSFSLHPGVINTNLGRHVEGGDFSDLQALDEKVGYGGWEFKFKSLSQGCATHVVAAFDPTITGTSCYLGSLQDQKSNISIDHNGSYLEDCTIFQPLQPWASDPEAAKRLWDLSEELVGEKFEL
jgi:hypothetical protein